MNKHQRSEVAVRAFVKATGFKARPGEIRLISNAEGALSAVLQATAQRLCSKVQSSA